jgi:hypothetical protein
MRTVLMAIRQAVAVCCEGTAFFTFDCTPEFLSSIPQSFVLFMVLKRVDFGVKLRLETRLKTGQGQQWGASLSTTAARTPKVM